MTYDELLKHSFKHPILAYDGVCLLCNGYVKWLIKRDKKEIFRFVALQNMPEIKRNLQTSDNDTVVLLKNGNLHTHSDVGIMITKYLSGLWPLLSVFIYIPRFMRDIVYRMIASYRYRWFGKVDSCILPDPRKKHLFLASDF